ncbi:PAS domain S-box protein [Actinoplanes sp. NPDC049548]|uniref:PAS domain S-box protein n=1 Tax=Actinoplanes sp. NPDC049548 TaxID=3155152 RepID=UPI003427A1E0
MAVVGITALYLLIFVWVAGSYLRRRDPLLRYVMPIFAVVGMLFGLGVLRWLAGEAPVVIERTVQALVLAQPFFTMRLVSKIRRVAPWMLWGAAAVWLAGAAAIVLLRPPFPAWVGWLIVAGLFTVEAAAATLLSSEARRRGGAARIRLWCAAVGTALFGVALLAAGAGSAAATVSRTLAMVSAVMYMLAFAPPRRLRRAWSWGAAYAVMRRLVAAPADEPAEQVWRNYCLDVRGVLGADAVAVLLPDADGSVRPISDRCLELADGPYSGADVQRLLQATSTVDALAGWTDPPRVAADLARSSGTRFVSAAPLSIAGGGLVLLHRYRALFAEDDLALFAELAGQAAAVAHRADVLQERQRLAVIVESSDDAIVGKDLEGAITSWNAGARRLYGYADDEVIGRHAAMLFPDGLKHIETEILERVLRGERVNQFEVDQRRRDGATVTASLTASLIADSAGQPVGVACVARDISERRRAEARFRGLLEAAPDAIVGVTEDGRITLLNAQAEKLFQHPRDDLLGQSIELLVPKYRQGYFADPQRRQVGAGEALCVRKDGTEFPAEISLSTLETDQGVIVSAAIRDVTERLNAQAERERLVAQAERDAAERRLQHTRRLESLGQLAGGVAHDFNNLLAVIASYTELLSETLADAEPRPDDLAAARSDLAQIGRATERATRLTKQLLAFGRREITQAQVLSLNDVVGDVEQMLRRTLGEHIHLITHLDRDLWPVCVDPSQVEQILVNLAVNARDAMPAGGTLSIDTGNTELGGDDVADQPSLAPGRYVRVRVSDTGSGMPPEVAERAFEPFYTTKPQGAGTGLGLATVYGIATAAGGHVRISSEAGIGTTVSIVLPASDDGPPPEQAGAPGEANPSPAGEAPEETILLVEDEHALRESTSRTLVRAGYHVLVADDGAAAVRIARETPGPIHLLLTDVIMPEMMGNEVAARVRELRPDVPVLYMSGYAQPVLTENGTLPPGVEIVEKPFTRTVLLERVQARLHKDRSKTS